MNHLMKKMDFLVEKQFCFFDLLSVLFAGMLAHSSFLLAVLAAVLLVSWLSRVRE